MSAAGDTTVVEAVRIIEERPASWSWGRFMERIGPSNGSGTRL
jgi:hypothetical protein